MMNKLLWIQFCGSTAAFSHLAQADALKRGQKRSELQEEFVANVIM